jgi:hypothetical protein
MIPLSRLILLCLLFIAFAPCIPASAQGCAGSARQWRLLPNLGARIQYRQENLRQPVRNWLRRGQERRDNRREARQVGFGC